MLTANGGGGVATHAVDASVALSLDEERLVKWGHLDRGWLVRRLLLTADLVAIVAAGLVVWFFAGSSSPLLDHHLELALAAAALPTWVVGAKSFGLYSDDAENPAHSTADDIFRVFLLVTVGAFLVAQLSAFASTPIGAAELTVLWLFTILLIALTRSVARAIARRQPLYVQNAVIAGAGEIGQLVAKKILQHPEYGIKVTGFVDADPMRRRYGVDHIPVLGGLDELPGILSTERVDRVIVAFSNEPHERQLELIRLLRDSQVYIDIVPRLFDVVGPKARMHSVEGLPLVGLPRGNLSRSSALLKRALDLLAAIAGLIVLAPVFAAIALLIKLDSRGPVFFRQIRIGNDGRAFRIFKFRTMVCDAEERKCEVAHLNKHACTDGDPRMFKVPDDPRVTRVGRFVRRYSLDELPQLLNVLKGEMTLVGPRPLIPEEQVHVREWAQKRLALKPGITGIWQVLGRDDIPFEEMVKLDYVYVTDWALLNDIKLILRTVPVMFRRRAVH